MGQRKRGGLDEFLKIKSDVTLLRGFVFRYGVTVCQHSLSRVNVPIVHFKIINMKRLLFSILLLPVLANAQGNTDIFGRFSIPASLGGWLKGTSKNADFKDYFIVTDLVASSSNNNTTVQFTVPVSPGANAFHFGAILPTGEIVVTTRGPGRSVINYKITMQQILP